MLKFEHLKNLSIDYKAGGCVSGVSYLNEVLTCHSTLECVLLRFSNWDFSTLSDLVHVLKGSMTNKDLRKLGLDIINYNFYFFDSENGEFLIPLQYLTKRNLEVLDLCFSSYLEIPSEAASDLVNSIQTNTNLKVLRLCFSGQYI